MSADQTAWMAARQRTFDVPSVAPVPVPIRAGLSEPRTSGVPGQCHPSWPNGPAAKDRDVRCARGWRDRARRCMIRPAMEQTAANERWSVLRDLIAVAIIAVACPVALFGGSLIGCMGEGFNADCAMDAVFISPIVLIGAGLVAGLVTRGWTGLFEMFVGVFIGMTGLLVLSSAVGRPVPLDPISGIIATIWFGAPVGVGYGIGRVISHLFERSGEDRPGSS